MTQKRADGGGGGSPKRKRGGVHLLTCQVRPLLALRASKPSLALRASSRLTCPSPAPKNDARTPTRQDATDPQGQTAAVFVVVVAATEAAVALALLFAVYRTSKDVDLEHTRELRS